MYVTYPRSLNFIVAYLGLAPGNVSSSDKTDTQTLMNSVGINNFWIIYKESSVLEIETANTDKMVDNQE